MTGVEVDADVVIIGAGVAGGLIAHRLAGEGIKVLILEGGPDITRVELRERLIERKGYSPVSLDPITDYAPTTRIDDPDAYLINEGRARYNVLMTKAVGGTTWHWGGHTKRFPEVEFKLKSTYGVGVDWPISLADLEPHYVRAERELGVSAPSVGPEAEGRSEPTPMVDFLWPHHYKLLEKNLAPTGYRVEASAFARNSRDYDGRPACRGNNTCWPLCPIGAQYSGIVHIDKARDLGVEVRPQSLVTRLETNGEGRVSAAVYRRPDGSTGRVSARAFVLAANGVETPKLLLASASEGNPDGVANSSGQVGRTVTDHILVLSEIASRDPTYPGRGPASFGLATNLRPAASRHTQADFVLGLENRMNVDVITAEVLREGFKGDDLDREVRFRASRTFMLASEVEMLPSPDNRLRLDWDRRDSAGQPRIRVSVSIDDYTRRGVDDVKRIIGELKETIGVHSERTFDGDLFGNHPCSAVRMGHDPRASVVDPECRAHDCPNLFVAGSSVFPTVGGGSVPTLTIAALALRLSDTLIADLPGL